MCGNNCQLLALPMQQCKKAMLNLIAGLKAVMLALGLLMLLSGCDLMSDNQPNTDPKDNPKDNPKDSPATNSVNTAQSADSECPTVDIATDTADGEQEVVPPAVVEAAQICKAEFQSNDFADERFEISLPHAQLEIEQGNFAHAFLIWHALAQDDELEAQYNLGWVYHNGYGVAVDNQQAVYWWQKSAAQGHLESLFDLGNLYYHGGGGVKRNRETAVQWFVQAASRGHDEAQTILQNLVDSNHRSVQKQRVAVDAALQAAAVHAQADINTDKGSVVRVKPAWANVRAQPSLTAELLKPVPRNTILTVLERSEEWVNIALGQVAINEDGTMADAAMTGWIHISLLASMQAMPGSMEN